MCKADLSPLENPLHLALAAAAGGVGSAPLPGPLPAQGSRRRRLWELGPHAHCPIIGVCLPIDVVRRLVDKALRGQAQADDYELHCGTVADCKQRTPIAEIVQRELDRRCARSLREAAAHKSTEALATWWYEALGRHDIAGPLWATLTHARCTPALEKQVLGQVHMLQHQVGMAARVDIDRFELLLQENAVLARELAAAQQRCTQQGQDHARQVERLQSQLVQSRGEQLKRDTELAAAREDLQQFEASVPGLKSRFELTRQGQQQIERIHLLERTLLQSRQEAERQQRRADEALAELQRRDELAARTASTSGEAETLEAAAALLHDRAVLCVGGRPAAVPVYRQLIERTGGRFLHHDGGEEENAARLDASLAAADLVICQTGCISHNAYWRVKDHCKRTGKRCVFIDNPSRSGLERALCELKPVRPD